MLKDSGQQDARLPPKQGKSPVQIVDLARLTQFLSGQGPEAEAVKDLAIVVFWGMARIAKLTYLLIHGRARHMKELTIKEIKTYKTVTVLELHKAKTAKPGEIQLLKLQPMPSPLCPVRAIGRRKQATQNDTDSLFGYNRPTGRINLTKRRVNGVLANAWSHLGKPHLIGHSFRVGGATLWNALGIKVEELQTLGRWTTDCYLRYIKPLSHEDGVLALSILELPSF
jgi:hypothetical protein